MIVNFQKRKKAPLRRAGNYQEWSDAARDYDQLSGWNKWKSKDQTLLYDFRSTRTRLDKIRSLRFRGNDEELLFFLNEGIHGNQGGIGNSELYRRALFGTKNLVAEYNEEIASALEYLAQTETGPISWAEKREFCHRRTNFLT